MLAALILKLRIIKHNLKTSWDIFKWKAGNWVSYRADKLIRSQLIDPLSIPIVIISFNQLFYLKKLIDFLLKNNFSNIVIIDNSSDYPPLLAYFASLSTNKKVTIHKLTENIGHLVFWENTDLYKKYSKGYHVVTDADIVPLEDTPKDFITKFRKLLDNNREISKVGFSLYLDDLPESNPNRDKIISWEEQFWKNKVNNYFNASIDTTFALYRPNYSRSKDDFLKAIRTDAPYTAMHGGWYIDPTALTEEQKYYIQTANDSSSWLTNKDGELKNKSFKDHYSK